MNHLKLTNMLGEGVLWDASAHLIWWTDISSNKLYSYHFKQKKLKEWPTPERLCSFGLYRPGQNQLLAVFESGFAIYSPVTTALEWLYRPILPSGVRFNDGRCDRQGRFWSGTMGEGYLATEKPGQLFCLVDKDHLEIRLEKIGISNSLCWSLDSKTLYFADSAENRIDAFDFEPDTGLLGNRRCFVQLPPGIYPDGSTIDTEGFLWNAQWGGSRVVRYTPDGREDCVIALPVSQPSCVAFGGPNLNILLVTTAQEGLSKTQLEKEPLAGSLFMIETDYRGMPEELVQFP